MQIVETNASLFVFFNPCFFFIIAGSEQVCFSSSFYIGFCVWSSTIYRISHFQISHFENRKPMRLPLQRPQPFPRVSSANVASDYTCAAQWERLKRPLPRRHRVIGLKFPFCSPADGTCLRRAARVVSSLTSRPASPQKTWEARPLIFHGVIVADRLMLGAANFRSCLPHMLPTLQRFPEDEQRVGGASRFNCYRVSDKHALPELRPGTSETR